MRVDVFSLFPEFFASPLDHGILRVARERGRVDIHIHDFRAFGRGGYRRVDDRPFGGGPGMLLRPEPPIECFEAVLVEPRPRIIAMTPQGNPLTQSIVAQIAALPHLAILCGHYEGFDERIIEVLTPLELSIGDYILSGGEVAALVLLDAAVRLLPGVVGDERSTAIESFASGLLDHPQYTRPVDFRGLVVPDVLRCGDHRAIETWRRNQAHQRTSSRRPDLLRR